MNLTSTRRMCWNLNDAVARNPSLANLEALGRGDTLDTTGNGWMQTECLVDDRIEVLEFREGDRVQGVRVGKCSIEFRLQFGKTFG
jgi:hypothetical protein